MAKKKALIKKAGFRLEDRLVLAPWIAYQIGLRKVSDIKQFKDVPEGFDTDGRSYMFYAIRNLSPPLSGDKLREYDDNIRGYVERLSRNRGETIRLKYFQYLAVLFTEIYLDSYFRDSVQFANELTIHAQVRFPDAVYGRNDLRKVAFWMATGSGKTLILHLNLWQFLAYQKKYRKDDFDNIILVTPNEGMSNQHLEELTKSGIPSRIFQSDIGGYFDIDDRRIVKVIDIYKLKLPEDKRGEGVTMDVYAFGHKNLVFVDEGHKGQKSEDQKWKQIREKLGKDGFTFEYSATFGQAITGKRDNADDVLEYSKAILFDYSYKYFHGDGYGKNFRVLNLAKDDDKYNDIVMLANTMAFYEQLLIFDELGDAVKSYNVEAPLWVFVGSRVNEKESDILYILKFFSDLLQNKGGWAEKRIQSILAGKSEIPDHEGRDVFARHEPETVFPYLRKHGFSSSEVLKGIYERVFLVPLGIGRKLHLADIKRTEGELGLRGSSSSPYFGVINIGNKSEFKKLSDEVPDIKLDSDVVTKSLFDAIDKSDSTINILIGAKKFIEGWNCWRVSNMGLLNVGRTEGAQIIQLFGRGVRLKGKGFSLKRSSHLDPPHPPYIEVLETLDVFGIRADYMTAFRDMISQEEVVTYNEFKLQVRKREPFPDNLLIPRLKQGADFLQDHLFSISQTANVIARVNDLAKASVVESFDSPSIVYGTDEADARLIGSNYLEMLDWNGICLEMMKYRVERGFFNLAFNAASLKQILSEQRYSLRAPKEKTEPSDFESLMDLQELVVRILRNYFDRYYNHERNGWEKENIEIVPLDPDYENIPREYSIQIDASKEAVAKEARDLTDNGTVYTRASKEPLPNVHFSNHLYQPLLAMPRTGDIVTTPVGLNEGERRFVQDLASFLDEDSRGLKADSEVYLLRNFTRGKGIGFFESNSFYPDFLLWVRNGSRQRLIFVDPKGLTRIGSLDNQKLHLHETLKNDLQPKIGSSSFLMDAFIISVTPYDIVRDYYKISKPEMRNYEELYHILFQETSEGRVNPDYIGRMFDLLLNA